MGTTGITGDAGEARAGEVLAATYNRVEITMVDDVNAATLKKVAEALEAAKDDPEARRAANALVLSNKEHAALPKVIAWQVVQGGAVTGYVDAKGNPYKLPKPPKWYEMRVLEDELDSPV